MSSFFTNGSAGLARVGEDGTVYRFTQARGWVAEDAPTLTALGRDWWPISVAEADEVRRAIVSMAV